VNPQQGFIANKNRYFPQHKLIERNFDAIKQECSALINAVNNVPKAHQVDQYNATISFDNVPGWRTFYLKVYSGWFPENCTLCPKTYRLFKNMNNVTAIMFSIMEPGNKIPPHKGELKGVLRYQLPLMVPTSGKCTITVAGQSLDYRLGESLLFDDNLLHSVENNSNEYRIVLFLDIQKPGGAVVTWLDNLFMKLVVLSPRFKKANVYLS